MVLRNGTCRYGDRPVNPALWPFTVCDEGGSASGYHAPADYKSESSFRDSEPCSFSDNNVFSRGSLVFAIVNRNARLNRGAWIRCLGVYWSVCDTKQFELEYAVPNIGRSRDTLMHQHRSELTSGHNINSGKGDR